MEGQYKGGSLEAMMNHPQVEMEEVMKLRQVGKYSGRQKGKGEKEQCPRCTYERHEGRAARPRRGASGTSQRRAVIKTMTSLRSIPRTRARGVMNKATTSL